MSGVVIESAYYGDEKSFANITGNILKKVTGGVLNVTANADLKPTFEAAPETTLDNRDQRRIREESVAACGGEADQACLERTRLKLSQERLKEKEREDLSKSVIKGDRLTVVIKDEKGKKRTLITPAGQKFELKNVLGSKDTAQNVLPTVDALQTQAITLITVIVGTFLWVFGIVATYTVFMRQYEATGRAMFQIAAYVSAALALIFPGTGYVIILLYFGFQSFIAEYIAKE